MLNFQDLPDELVLKILGYSESKDLITYGQVSKRIRKISRDGTLWMTANLANKIVKTELLEMILSKGCEILNISNSTIIGSFSSNMESQLRALDLSQSAIQYALPANGSVLTYSKENTAALEKLLSSCLQSLQYLNMEGLLLTPKMSLSICINGATMEVLNLNNSYFIEDDDVIEDDEVEDDEILEGNDVIDNNGYVGSLQAIIKFCTELKELTFINYEDNWFDADDLEYLAKNISPNIVKVNLSNHDITDDHVKILLSRCSEIKVLILKATLITTDSLETIRQCLNHTLEELSVPYYGYKRFTRVFKLKSMQRLKILNLYSKKEEDEEIVNLFSKNVDDSKEIQCLRRCLPHLMLRTFNLLNKKISKLDFIT